MAVPSSPAPSEKNKEGEVGPTQRQSKRRSKDPGVRVKSGRIYDSRNGKTCHQCRQKTMDFTARCKNLKKDKQCTIMFCHKCLLNRYGEKAEEMAIVDDWNCPKCRGMCNCSVCMKKRGHKPTGILVHTAKATGFSSVSQLLDVKGPDVSQELIVKSKAASPKNSIALTEGIVVVSPKKQGKENFCNTNISSKSPPASPIENKVKKPIQEGINHKVAMTNGLPSTPIKEAAAIVLRRSPRKFNLPQENTTEEKKMEDDKETALRRSPRKCSIPEEGTTKEELMAGDNNTVPAIAKVKETQKEKKTKGQAEKKVKNQKINKDKDTRDDAMDIALPPGTLLTSLRGVDLVPEDIGYALQFLEFCSTFGEVLDIRNGHPESVLRDIMAGRSRRKGKCSSTIQFLIQLLSFILKEEEEESPCLSPTDGKDSWIHSLKRCLSKSELELEDVPEDCFDKGCLGYEMLEPSQKLKLLTFLCDEALSTEDMRNWIDDQNLKFVKKGKVAKESLNAAKEKEKQVKRMLQDEVAKTLLVNNGAPLTVSEHGSIISKIKAESNRLHEEMLGAMDLVPKKRQRSDAVGTEPVLSDDNYRAFWRLKGVGEPNFLLQERGAPEEITAIDKWFTFGPEEMKAVENYICSVRLKRHKRDKLANQTKIKRSKSDLGENSDSNNDTSPATNVSQGS